MNDTPRTDKEVFPSYYVYNSFAASNYTEALNWVSADFARQLERELNEANGQLLAAQTLAIGIARYAEHRDDCSSQILSHESLKKCSCGLSNLLKQLPSPPP